MMSRFYKIVFTKGTSPPRFDILELSSLCRAVTIKRLKGR